MKEKGGKVQLQRALQRWKRAVKKKLDKGSRTGEGRQMPLTDAEKLILATMIQNKKSLGENLRVTIL